jgi:hypothetical protein
MTGSILFALFFLDRISCRQRTQHAATERGRTQEGEPARPATACRLVPNLMHTADLHTCQVNFTYEVAGSSRS